MMAVDDLSDNIQAQQMNKQRKRWLKRAGMFFIVLGILCLFYWLAWGRFNIYTDDAYVNGNMVDLMSQVSGTVVSVNTDDTNYVVEGQPLIRLDDTDRLVAMQKARANLAVTVRQVRQDYENVKQAKALLISRAAALEQANFDLKRRQGLVAQNAISKEELQHYQTADISAQAQYNDAKYRFVSALALVANTNLYNHPLVKQAEANYKAAYLSWIRTTIYSPVTGFVAKRSVQVGQQITAGTILLSVISLKDIWVDANYKETQLSRIRVGQSVKLIADANEIVYHGKVVGFSPGTGGVFALLPPQNATGNWIKIVQRLPIRVVIDPKELRKNPLQLGLSMRVTIYTRGLKGEKLSRVIRKSPLYVTTIYNDQLAKVDQDIETILKTNSPDVMLKAGEF